MKIPSFLPSAVVYQISLRSFTREGTLRAAEAMLPHVKVVGVDVVYLTPFVEMDTDMDRSGWSPRQIKSGFETPKNPYRISDYTKVDPEYGTEGDLVAFVAAAHGLGLKVFFDLVYLHCGPNNVIQKDIPDAFQRNEDGSVKTTVWRFPYINFASPAVREYLYANMTHFAKDVGCDGFRCDVGDEVPEDFWYEGLRRMQRLNPDFAMINEGSQPGHVQRAFHCNYGWNFSWGLRECATGTFKPGRSLVDTIAEQKAYEAKCPPEALELFFFENHDTANDEWENRIDRVLPVEAGNAILAGCPTGAETARYQREVALERALLAQWEKHARLANEDLTMIPLSKAQGGDLFAGAKKHPMMSHAKATQSAFVQFARSRDALHVRVNAVRDMAALKKGVAGHDGSAVWADCDYVEIFFDPGDAAGYRHLMVNPAGGHYDAQGMDTSWNPFWSHGVKLLEDRWVLDVSIPFSNFEKPVADGDEWPVVVDFCRLADDDGPNQFGFPAPMFHDVSGGAVLHFSPAVETAGKDVLWYGAEKSNTEWFAPGLLEDGWSFTSAAAGTNAIGTQPEDFTLIVMYTYNGNQIPQSFWNEHLVPAVTNGATIVFNTFGTMIPLEQWFSNPDLRVAIDSQKNDIQDRQVYFEKTSFATMPNDMARCSSFLEELPTFTPTNKARWTVLAEIKKADGSKAPILMAAKVGRGMVVLSHPIRSGRSPLSVARFLSNVLAWGIAQSPR